MAAINPGSSTFASSSLPPKMPMPQTPPINLSDVLSTAIKSTQELRVSVGHVFDQLSEGMAKSESEEGKEKQFLANFEKRLLTVVKHFTDLEKISISLPPTVATPNLGNTSLLTLDSITDKTPTYQHLLQAYRWSSKTHDHATLALAALNQQSLKRSQTSSLLHGKRPRKIQGTSHSLPNSTVDALLSKMTTMFPDMNIEISRPIGSPTVLHITLGMTLKAIVVLRGLVIEWVTVKGYDEDFCDENGKLDIWSKSKHLVFQKKWLRRYITLFSTPCHRCGKYLRDNLPPTWHHTLTSDVYHEGCRP